MATLSPREKTFRDLFCNLTDMVPSLAEETQGCAWKSDSLPAHYGYYDIHQTSTFPNATEGQFSQVDVLTTHGMNSPLLF